MQYCICVKKKKPHVKTGGIHVCVLMWCTCVCISLLHALNYLDNLIIKKLSQYEEDFKHEREDRIRAIEARDRIIKKPIKSS